MKKIGLMGGTFDPPHQMHLLIAQEALEACRLDEVWFLPTYDPPHIQGKVAQTSADDRVQMVRRAISGNSRFRISLVEVERGGKSYTVETVRELTRRFPDDRFYFILGADMVDDLPNWHGIEELCRMTSFIAFRRPGFPAENPAHADVAYINMPLIDISSSLIRDRLQEGRSCRYFMPDAVIDYIKGRHLYED
ncbi:nicotinate-nucleotide adenylyltransferase [Sporolactobacillus vineae]|uniref:nicotinate-nucleotide adenylyltransferase n=1 Tax=Sporolactobacillus vineae TaxID=444463 RepID=UPI000287B819|nr:nicotinate-nucleotide adenylyltransferase [Sporolactobacillus vineae]